MANDDALHLETILELIGRTRTSLQEATETSFIADLDKVDATAFRLSLIGEAAKKLSDPLKVRRAEIAWRNIYGFRNIIVHHYDQVDPTRVWETATTSLEPLEVVCRQELDRLTA